MFHKVKTVSALSNYKLNVQFAEGLIKVYDVKPLFKKWEQFKALEEVPGKFESVKVDQGGYGISWDDEIDLSCDELFANGEAVSTPFDGLIAFTDATELWGLNESTLRKAISYGKLAKGIDACKYGNQWIVSVAAMKREYGEPV
jgi:hypothetical protein